MLWCCCQTPRILLAGTVLPISFQYSNTLHTVMGISAGSKTPMLTAQRALIVLSSEAAVQESPQTLNTLLCYQQVW